MIFPSGILKNGGASVAPIDHYPIPARPDGRRDSASISFIASSMSMVPTGPMGTGLANIVDDPRRIKLSECEMDEDLEPLIDKNIVFIRQLPQDLERYINVPNKYQVVTSSGERLYDVIETTDGLTRRLFRRDQPFTMRVINSYGEYICELHGDPGIGGLRAYVKMNRESKTLGRVVQINPCFACCNFSPTYKVLDDKGKTISKIVWRRGRLKSCMFTDDFQIYSATRRNSLVGSISRQTKAICLEDYGQADTYALSFQDAKLDSIHKALLIAAVVMLDFQFFEGREGSDLWKVLVCCLIVVLVALCVAGIVVYMVSSGSAK